MQELLEIYDLKGKLLRIEERDNFYSKIRKEFIKKGIVSEQVKTIRLILMNSKGRLYLQKRSKSKEENRGLYDKTIGGHVRKRDTFDMTVIRECAEELGFPASVLSPEEFNNAIKVTDLKIVGLFKKVDYISKFQSVRLFADGKKIIQPQMTAIYLGYYNGPIRFVDGESSGVEVFTLKELEKEMKDNPSKFTEDIKFMIRRYKKYIKPV